MGQADCSGHWSQGGVSRCGGSSNQVRVSKPVVDPSSHRTGLTSSRKGYQDERDPLKLRDGKSRPICCYACGGSSLPLHSLTTDPGSTGRPIVSCDYCALSWHLDCMNPPLASMPNSGRKWMCPNHAEQVMVSLDHERTCGVGQAS
jgi:hypothetical protein